MRRINRLLSILGALVILALVVAACQPPQPPEPEPGEQDTTAPDEATETEPSEDTADTGSDTGQEQTDTTEQTESESDSDAYGTGTGGGAAFRGAFPYKVPPEGHLNSFLTGGIPLDLFIYHPFLELPGAMYRWGDGEWLRLLAEDWETDTENSTFVLHLREGVKWSNGDDFTAEDVVVTFNVGRLFKWTVWNYVDTVTAVDDHTVEFHMSNPSTVVERYVLTEKYRSRATYGELAAKVQQLVDEGKDEESEEWKALVKEASDYRPEELVVTGPFNLDLDSINDSQLTMVKNPDSYLADTVKFDEVVIYNGETPTITPLVLSGEVDYATHGFPPATEKAFVEQGIRIIRAPTYSGPAIYVNHDIYPLNRREVRQAIAYAINRAENGTVSLGDSGVAVENMAGFSDNLVPQWMDESQVADLNRYEYDPEKAEALMTEIGFERDSDGVWIDDQGNRMEYELIVPAEFADWSAAAENASEQLTNFGIKTTVRGVQFQQHLTDVNQGKFEIAIRGWGIGSNPHPHFSFRQNLFTHNIAIAGGGSGMKFPMKQEVNGEEIDFEQLVIDSAQGLDEAAQKDNVATIATAFNQVLPIIPLWERYGNNPALDTRITGWLGDDDPLYQNAVYGDNFVVMQILDGTLKPAE